MSRLTKVKERSPELLDNPAVFDMAEQADKLHNLKTLTETDGGKDLVRLLLQSVVNNVHTLGNLYKKASHEELVSTIAEMTTHLHTARLLVKSGENLEFIDKELEEMLRN